MFRQREQPAPRRRRGVEVMEAHVAQLCREHGIELIGSSSRGRAIRWRGGRREIAIPPIKGQVSYFVALHEIGHLVGRGRSAPRLESEANAWLWALDHAIVEPTPATCRSISNRLHGYLRWAENRQYRRVPPRIPPREHPFWSLLDLAA
jgi:hypothetical protein